MGIKNVVKIETEGNVIFFTHPIDLNLEIVKKDGNYYKHIYLDSWENIGENPPKPPFKEIKENNI